MCRRSRNNAEVPNDLVSEIFLPLPVKSLLRFKSVCKCWKSLIEEPEFVSKHHHRGKKYFLSRTKDGVARKNTLPPFSSLQRRTPRAVATEVDLTDQLPREKQFHVYRPFNGIFCIDFNLNPDFRDLHLWNPATKELKALPDPQPRTLSRKDGLVWYRDAGFGFDSKTSDYKVVIIHYPDFNTNNCDTPPDRMLFAEVYSLRSDSWREIDAGHVLPSQIIGMYTRNWDLHIDGMCFWLLRDYEHFTVLSFDFASEIFTTTRLPHKGSRNLFRRYRFEPSDYFFVLNGCIAFIEPLSPDIARLGIIKSEYEIWALNEIGNEESWTKLHEFGPCSNLKLPLGNLKDDQLFVKSEYGGLLWCAPRDPTRTQCKDNHYPVTIAYSYKESIMKLGGTS